MNTLEDANTTYEAAARAAHEVNRAYCKALGDDSQPPWEDAPDWQRRSAFNGARSAIDDPSVGPGASHAGWLAEKEADGWKYGPVKDPAKKEHPCCVAFDTLPPDQKAKDYIFLATVRAVAQAMGA